MSKSPQSESPITGLVNQLKDLTNELTALHGDLYWLAMQGPDAAGKQSPAQLNVDLLTGLKGAVDNMRILLWKYIEAASQVDPQAVEDGMEAQRLRRVNEFLELLRERLGRRTGQEPVSFIEKIEEHLSNRKVA